MKPPTFADLPADFLAALCRDVVRKRSMGPGSALVLQAADTGGLWELPGDGETVALTGPLAEVTAYLTSRTHHLTRADSEAAPTQPAWL